MQSNDPLMLTHWKPSSQADSSSHSLMSERRAGIRKVESGKWWNISRNNKAESHMRVRMKINRLKKQMMIEWLVSIGVESNDQTFARLAGSVVDEARQALFHRLILAAIISAPIHAVLSFPVAGVGLLHALVNIWVEMFTVMCNMRQKLMWTRMNRFTYLHMYVFFDHTENQAHTPYPVYLNIGNHPPHSYKPGFWCRS